MSSQYIEIVGGIAGTLTTIAFFPQAYKVYKTSDTSAISLKMFIILNIGLICWTVYGIMLKQIAVVIPNVTTFLLAFYILIRKIREKNVNESSLQK